MRLYILILIFFLIGLVFSQERMQGTYTIGGTNPDFASVQEAADSLMSKGVSGPVTFNIRPGLYEEAGGTERVLFIDQSIPGISGTNMITYRSDEAEGGNANNVIFQRTAQVGSPAGYVVEISYGYMHFRDLTFQNADTTSEDTAPSIFHIMPNTNFSADSVFIENCQFIGDAGNRRSYDGIKWNRNFNNMHFDNNYIRGCNNGIRHYLLAGTNQSKVVVITNNYITGLQRYSYGGSGIGGWGIRLVESDSAVVSGNTLDYQSGGSGRYGYVLGCNYLTFEKNKIIGLRQSPEFKGIALEGSNNKIYNNMFGRNQQRNHLWHTN